MYIQVTFTCPNDVEAKSISNALVRSRLAACVQMSGPITSTYEWKGDIHHDEEWMCFAKTRAECYEDVEKLILKMHSYETPEIIATQILKGSKEYLEWLEKMAGGQ